MDQQTEAMNRIGHYVAERYPLYVANSGFEHWLYEKAGHDREMIDSYLATLEDYGYIAGDGAISEEYGNVPDPVRVQDDIARRVGRLTPEAIDLLAMASVEGEHFSTAVITELRGGDDGIEALLKSAVASGVIAPESNRSTVPAFSQGYRFVPLQARAVLYERLPQEERLRLHAALVEYFSAEVQHVSDHGAQDMLNHRINEHNKLAAQPDPPPAND